MPGYSVKILKEEFPPEMWFPFQNFVTEITQASFQTSPLTFLAKDISQGYTPTMGSDRSDVAIITLSRHELF